MGQSGIFRGLSRSLSGGLPLCAGKRQKGLGFDTIGIDPIADEGLTRHRLLLSQRDIVIIENLTNLDKIGEGLFLFAALPLKYENADGAPVRAVAMLEEE